MKVGKVSQTTWRRTVSKYIDNSSGSIQTAIEECCVDFSGKDTMVKTIVSTATAVGSAVKTPVFAMAEAYNDVLSKGAVPKGIVISLDLPVWMEEKTLDSILMEAARAGKEHKLPITNIQVQTIPSLKQMVVHVTLIGCATDEETTQMAESKTMDVVVAGPVGLAGSVQLLAEKEPELKRYFQQGFLNTLKSHQDEIFATVAVNQAVEAGAKIWQTGQGGVLAALWNMGETLGVGMELDMKKFPILQETIEVCEQYDVNPYLLTSAGTFVFVVQRGEYLAEMLRQSGCKASVIGHTIRRKERVLRNGEDIRYLDRPTVDEIWKIL